MGIQENGGYFFAGDLKVCPKAQQNTLLMFYPILLHILSRRYCLSVKIITAFQQVSIFISPD